MGIRGWSSETPLRDVLTHVMKRELTTEVNAFEFGDESRASGLTIGDKSVIQVLG